MTRETSSTTTVTMYIWPMRASRTAHARPAFAAAVKSPYPTVSWVMKLK